MRTQKSKKKTSGAKRYDKNIWLTANQVVELFHRKGIDISLQTFFTYCCKGTLNIKTRKHYEDGHKRLYHRGDVLDAFDTKYHEFLRAKNEALDMIAEADASGNWYTFDEVHALALEINSNWKERNSFEYKLYYTSGRVSIRMLFPKFKHNGFFGLKLGIEQRYWKADVNAALKLWLEQVEREKLSPFETVTTHPGETWVPISQIANGARTIHDRLKSACARGLLYGVIFKNNIYTDIIAAREFIAWRSVPWLKRHWSTERIEKRLAWQEDVGLHSPFTSDEHFKITVYAPELAHL